MSINPVGAINDTVRALDWTRVKDELRHPNHVGYCLYTASAADFEQHVVSEDQEPKSVNLEWRNGFVYIVELSTGMFGALAGRIDIAMCKATGTGPNDLFAGRSTYLDTDELPAAYHRRKIEPTCCFGPTYCCGAVLPPGIPKFCEFHTLKVEIGVFRGWNLLDPRVLEWSTFPGVQYIFCVRVSEAMDIRKYKLLTVENGALHPAQPADVDPIPIEATTRIAFDSRRLLALTSEMALPQGFNTSVVLALHPLLQYVWRQCVHSNTLAPF